jgi:IS30 family transposase
MSGGMPLCAEEREKISRELSRKNSAHGIAKLLGRHHSTIAREINRNGGATHYRAWAQTVSATPSTVLKLSHRW